MIQLDQCAVSALLKLTAVWWCHSSTWRWDLSYRYSSYIWTFLDNFLLRQNAVMATWIATPLLSATFLTCQGIRLCGDGLAGISDSVEIDSPRYQTPGRLTRRGIRPPRASEYQTPGRLTWQGIRPREDWLARVSDPGEIDSPRYKTPQGDLVNICLPGVWYPLPDH